MRLLTAASLFDGHDAAINLVRRVLVEQGAQVVHLGHNRGVAELVKAALEEEVQALCISCYQGGHLDFFTYLLTCLREAGAGSVQVFGGGGGVILPDEVERLHQRGVTRIYTPEDGLRLGIEGMMADLLERAAQGHPGDPPPTSLQGEPRWEARRDLGHRLSRALRANGGERLSSRAVPVLGLTGTGGAGKSSLLDELLGRFLRADPALRIGVLALDPTRRRGGGALLGDRLRVNTAADPRIFFRSVPDAGDPAQIAAVHRAAQLLGEAGADLVVVETTGIGQGDTSLLEIADLSVYVMTQEYGAPTQLEKINMLDCADLVVVNKCEGASARDALQAVRRQVRRSRRVDPALPDESLPVFGTSAARYGDPGVEALFQALCERLHQRFGLLGPSSGVCPSQTSPSETPREGYLRDIVQAVRSYRNETERLVLAADRLQALEAVHGKDASHPDLEVSRRELGTARELLEHWEDLQRAYGAETFTYTVRGREHRVPLVHWSPSGLPLRRVSLPSTKHWGEILRYLRQENLPGAFPYTSGAFPFRRTDEEPKRQFAGEGSPERTNRRFHLLCQGERSRRLSVAFDSVTLYGEDPDPRPDILGKVGESGVSIATLDDMKALFAGFDLCDPATSVSMTINGPAPVLLALFLNVALDQQREAWRAREGRDPEAEEEAHLRESTFRRVRGTVQADILKEDQAQNTCIFSIDFALRLMGDVQAFLVAHRMENYYSVSISGYHIAEAGATPVTQLAFTLANGFTLLECFLARGLKVDEIARNLSFFFSSGLDPEYAVLGRVARRLWAIALREVYGAQEAAQRLKFHIQTSGRSLHLKEMSFNDIRTTLQALTALLDNCNSLHTNAHDEALTTPTEESVRMAMAIQLILTREFGLYISENLLQGSHFMEALTDQVEEAVLEEFLALHARGGVLKAMEHHYQRLKIQDQSHAYEQRKHSGEQPVIGVNTFVRDGEGLPSQPQLSRATLEEKEACLHRLRDFQARHAAEAPAALARLERAVCEGSNVFEELLHTVRVASLGQITAVLYHGGGRYRRAL